MMMIIKNTRYIKSLMHPSTAWIIRLLDADLQSILRAKEDFDINRVPFILEACSFELERDGF